MFIMARKAKKAKSTKATKSTSKRVEVKRKVLRMGEEVEEVVKIKAPKQVKAVDYDWAPKWKVRSETRALINRAKSRIRAFDKAGITNSAVENMRALLSRPFNKKTTDYNIVKEMHKNVSFFLNDPFSLLSNEKLRREAKKQNLIAALENAGYSGGHWKILFDYIDSVEMDKLFEEFGSPQTIEIGINILNSGISPTADLIRRSITKGLNTVLKDWLEQNGFDIARLNKEGNPNTIEYYVEIAKRSSVQQALSEYQSDLSVAQLNGLDFSDLY